MTRAAQNLLLVFLGAAVLWITLVSGEYVNYVRPGFRYPLVAAAVALLALGAAGLRREWRDAPGHDDGHPDHDHPDHDHPDHGHGHGHDHSRGPRVAWLLGLPVLAIFVIAPPALGSFSAARGTDRAAPPPAPPDDGFPPLSAAAGPVDMSVGEFIGRAHEAQTGDPAKLQGVPVRLTGFVTPAGKGRGGWQLTRMKIACCAGDAVPFPVRVRGVPQPPADSWVRVTGVWEPPRQSGRTVVQTLRAHSLREIEEPKNPYE
ncbi:TIGR03943 family putative permease subunit [Actinomadura livida]|uniref:Putative repeat protein (TIGR03943 family) n=1 Tax=Actinomadura livida TaxID=79909 RepID=A0A7W7IK67_9ACTN|nr:MULTISPECIES: TIGR03943 family protein [Actinomadura]MBB4778603.1 putative repeat protein (TIGR03943 family) [Actinomadura catellatispora]GGU30193.1 TIGR03943 family protein [Actinomadura livida]